MLGLARTMFDALRPWSLAGVAARIELRRRLLARLAGDRPSGISAHALPVGPDQPVTERIVVFHPIDMDGYELGPRSLHRVDAPLVDGRSGLAMIGGSVLHESGGVAADKRPKAQKWIVGPYLAGVERRARNAVIRIDRPVHHLGDVPRGNYYHWLIEVLPRILAVVEHDPDVLVLTPELPGFADEALTRLEIEHRLEVGPFRAASLLVVDPPVPSRPHPRELELLHGAGVKVLPQADPAPRPERVYVSRRQDRRALQDEGRLERWLQARGFTVFDASTHPRWIDQVALFSGARLVVGPHGAGLANAVFLPSGASVIELSPDAYSADMFAMICAGRGIPHRSLSMPVGPGDARCGTADLAIGLLEPLIEG